MPNIKSAIKRVSVIENKTLKNNMLKSEYKTAVKKFEAAVVAGDKAKAEEALKFATKKIDGACSKELLNQIQHLEKNLV